MHGFGQGKFDFWNTVDISATRLSLIHGSTQIRYAGLTGFRRRLKGLGWVRERSTFELGLKVKPVRASKYFWQKSTLGKRENLDSLNDIKLKSKKRGDQTILIV